MYRDQTPAWYRDAKWLSGLLLVLSLAAGLVFFSLAQLSARSRAVPLLERILELTLLPGGVETSAIAVRQGVSYTPGERLQLLPGVEVYADPTEVAAFTVGEAQSRIAGVLAEAVIAGGTRNALALMSDVRFGEQLRLAFEGPVPQIVRARLESAMLPSGLDNGSRLADWELQALQKPGEPVQPVVGVFIRTDPARLRTMNDREIGELVVAGLADQVLAEGLGSAQALVTNSNLQQRLTSTVQQEVRESLHSLFTALLLGHQDTIALRLEQAQAALAEEEAPADGLFGLVSAAELQGLTPEQANQVVLSRLAERAYGGGRTALASAITDPQQEARVASIAGLIDGLTSEAQQRYMQLTWLFGVLSFILLVALVLFSEGWGRLVNPGIALSFAAAAGTLLFTRLASALQGMAEVGLPTGVRVDGVFGYLAGLIAYVGSTMPDSALEVLIRNHLVVLAAGGALIVLSVLIWLGRLLRPRRRSYL